MKKSPSNTRHRIWKKRREPYFTDINHGSKPPQPASELWIKAPPRRMRVFDGFPGVSRRAVYQVFPRQEAKARNVAEQDVFLGFTAGRFYQVFSSLLRGN